MIIKSLGIENYRNYNKILFKPNEKINFIYGENGIGKTNILDAIYYLCYTKSFVNGLDSDIVQINKESFRLIGIFQKEDEESKVNIFNVIGQKKVITINERKIEKNSDYIGKFFSVPISPNDQDLIQKGNEERRRFLDQLISQIDQNYLSNLLKYNKVLLQRNNLLKKALEIGFLDQNVLVSYNLMLEKYGNPIFKLRKKYCYILKEKSEKLLNYFLGEKLKVEFQYKSGLFEHNYEDGLKKNYDKDKYSGRTNFGIHLDEMDFNINDRNLRRTGSQGQQKTFALAIKLANFEIISEEKKIIPILLLDDIFDKLDNVISKRFFDLLLKNNYSNQIFISSTYKNSLLDDLKNKIKYFNITSNNNILQDE